MEPIRIKKLVLVLAGGSPLWDRQEISCRETWGNPDYYGKDTKVFFVRGNLPFDNSLLDSEQHRMSKTVDELMSSSVIVNELTRTVNVDVPDGTPYLLFKCILAMRELQKHYRWDYFVRPNSGSYVNLNLLDMQLEHMSKTNLVYAAINGYNGLFKYPSGACFTMSKDVTDSLLEKSKEMIAYQRNTGEYDDIVIGRFLTSDIVSAPRIDTRFDWMQGSSQWFDPNCYHYYFMHTLDDRPHHLVHRMFYNNAR